MAKHSYKAKSVTTDSSQKAGAKKNYSGKTVAKGTSGQNTYVTKRMLVSAVRTGVRDASTGTLSKMGYTIIAHDGHIVQKFNDGQLVDLGNIKIVKTTKADLVRLNRITGVKTTKGKSSAIKSTVATGVKSGNSFKAKSSKGKIS